MALNQDFKEFTQSLNGNGVRYLVVGGYAVAQHGYPRYTKDIDIWVEVSRENAIRVVNALMQFGFASLGLKEQESHRQAPGFGGFGKSGTAERLTAIRHCGLPAVTESIRICMAASISFN